MANRQSWGTRLLLAIALLSAGIWLAGEARVQAVIAMPFNRTGS